MTTELAVRDHADVPVLSVKQITENVARIQAVMSAVMKENVHYGIVPGTQKPSLWKPGAEILNMTFRIAADPDRVEDLGGIDSSGVSFAHYRVRLHFVSQVTGQLLGSAWGECSTLEEKYKWRRATGPKEFEATPPDRRRKKWKRGRQNSEYEESQVRTEADDLRNTILQMAIKRAEVSGTKRVTACSDIFAQDLEDLPREVVESIEGEDGGTGAPTASVRKSEREKKVEQTEKAPEPHPHIGKVAEVKSVATGVWRVKLETGFIADTKDEAISKAASDAQASGRRIDLTTRASKKDGAAPVIEELTVAE